MIRPYSHINFHYLDPTDHVQPRCDRPHCLNSAHWRITSQNKADGPESNNAAIRHFCWPHAINWCARNLRLELNASRALP